MKSWRSEVRLQIALVDALIVIVYVGGHFKVQGIKRRAIIVITRLITLP